jgi:hypothetical protein
VLHSLFRASSARQELNAESLVFSVHPQQLLDAKSVRLHLDFDGYEYIFAGRH